ncbi:MAG TPA: M28 family peptidase [Terriglobales bacterium]|nr:M28 family peptidase [Terriglobales bacterium]
MLRTKAHFNFFLVIFCLSLSSLAQNASPWKVKPEWVRAHEMFLASDAMRGRGSATPDELIAATYVASQFERFGLKPGTPDGTFIQRVELVQPVIEGKATLTAQTSGITLEQGKDFLLSRTDGQGFSGPLLKVTAANAGTAQFQPGSVVLLGSDLGEQSRAVARRAVIAGAKALLRMDPSLTAEKMEAASEEGSSIHLHLAGSTGGVMGAGFSVVSLTSNAGDQLSGLSDGTIVSLQLQAKDTPRYSYNAIGVLPGKNSSANAKVLLLSAHLDHLGIGTPVNGDSIYNGADDDASGTTAVIELAHALASGQPLQRTVYFVCYGSEELGGLGSTYFREHPPIPLDRIAANLEFEMIGNQDPKMPKGKMLLTGWDRSNLGPTLVQHGALLGNDPYPEQHFFERSDNYPLALKGVVAHTAGGWGTPPTYHKPDDDLAHLDFNFMTEAIQSLIEPLRWLANSDFVPHWLPGKQPHARE